MKFLKKVLYVLYLSLACILLLEICVRLWGYSDRYIYDPIYQAVPGSQDIPYFQKPCLENAKARGLAVINTDALGLRALKSCEKIGPKGPGELRIAIAGDSVTFGEGVPNTKDTYPVVLERILEAKLPNHKVRVFNFGVSAYSVKEMASILKEKILAIDPDIVIMAIIPHDFDLGRTGIVDKWGYTVHMDSHSLLCRNPTMRNFLRHFHLLYLLRDLYHAYLERHKSIAGGGDVDEKVPASYRYIKKFADIAKKNGIQCIVVLLPCLDRKFSRELLSMFKKDHIQFLDISNLERRFTVRQFMASRFDAHPSAMVHKAIAQAIACFILGHMEVIAGQDPKSHPKQGR